MQHLFFLQVLSSLINCSFIPPRQPTTSCLIVYPQGKRLNQNNYLLNINLYLMGYLYFKHQNNVNSDSYTNWKLWYLMNIVYMWNQRRIYQIKADGPEMLLYLTGNVLVCRFWLLCPRIISVSISPNLNVCTTTWLSLLCK